MGAGGTGRIPACGAAVLGGIAPLFSFSFPRSFPLAFELEAADPFSSLFASRPHPAMRRRKVTPPLLEAMELSSPLRPPPPPPSGGDGTFRAAHRR